MIKQFISGLLKYAPELTQMPVYRGLKLGLFAVRAFLARDFSSSIRQNPDDHAEEQEEAEVSAWVSLPLFVYTRRWANLRIDWASTEREALREGEKIPVFL